MDKIGYEDNTSNPYTHGDDQPSDIGDTQRPQHVEAVHRQRGAQGFRHVHVPNKHGPYEESGMEVKFIL